MAKELEFLREDRQPTSDVDNEASFATIQAAASGQSKRVKRDRRGNIVEKHIDSEASTYTSESKNGLIIRMTTVNPKEQHLLEEFNTALVDATRAMYKDSCRLKLWNAYMDLKNQFPESLRHFPKTTWRKLWKTQATLRPTDANRLDSLATLIADMEKNSSYSWRVEQKVFLLEKQFAEGEQIEALAEWRSHCQGYSKFRSHLTSKMHLESDKWKEWLELGVRLHALYGDTDTASLLTHQILRRYRNCDPRFIFVQILSYNHWPESVLHRRAWSLYLQLRQLPKFSLCLDDFHGLFHSFLRAGQKGCALAVLKDMARLDLGEKSFDPILLDCVQVLHKSCRTEEELERYSISALSVLPVTLQSAVLYGSWLTQTRKCGTADDVARVIELMFERGVVPSAHHLDTLLRTWLESGDPDYTMKGERLAWAMIQKLQNRNRVDTEDNPLSPNSVAESKLGARFASFPRVSTTRPIAKASAMTFVRLARHYTKTGHADSARHVISLLMSSDIKPTRRHMRAILTIYVDLGDFNEAWQLFQKCDAGENTTIDLATYSTLWQGLIQQLHCSWRIQKKVNGIPLARELFMHMQEYMRAHGPISIIASGLGFTKSALPKNELTVPEARLLHKRVMRAFTLSKDTFGALLAMRALHFDLGMPPTIDTVGTLVQHAAHEAMMSECKIQCRRQDAKEYMPMAMQVLASLYQSTDASAPKTKPEAAKELLQPSISKKGESLLRLLETFMTTLMQRNFTGKQIVERLKEAREHMGLIPRSAFEHSTQEDELLSRAAFT